MLNRVESCLDGRGIYVGSSINLSIDDDELSVEKERVCLGDILVGGAVDSKRHPAPQNDSKLKDVWSDLENRSQYSFGFSSLTQYKKWLNKHEREICVRFLNDYLKYRLVAYKVPKDSLIVGDRQCIFVKEKAVKVAIFTATVVDENYEYDGYSNNKIINKMTKWCAKNDNKGYLNPTRHHAAYYVDDWIEYLTKHKINIDEL